MSHEVSVPVYPAPMPKSSKHLMLDFYLAGRKERGRALLDVPERLNGLPMLLIINLGLCGSGYA